MTVGVVSVTPVPAARFTIQVDLPALLSLAAIAAALMAWRWVGLLGSDDVSYYYSAEAWITSFPSVAQDHFAMRHTAVLPLAALIAVFGPHEWLLAALAAGHFAVAVLLTYLYVAQHFGRTAAWLGGLLLVTIPAFPIRATYLATDLIELAYVVVSLFSFLIAIERTSAMRWCLLAGLAAGGAFLTRETSLALVGFYGLRFLFWPGLPRSRYFIIGAGFLVVVASQMAYFTAMTGNPLHRFSVNAKLYEGSDRAVERGPNAPASRFSEFDREAEGQATRAAGHLLDREGNVRLHAWLDPFLVYLTNQKHGLLIYLAVPAIVGLLRRRRELSARQAAMVYSMLGLSFVWFAFVACAGSVLVLVFRYFMVATWGLAVLAGIGVAAWLGGPRRAVAGAAVGLVVASNVALAYVENSDPLFASRVVAREAARATTAVHTDPFTRHRARLLLHLGGTTDRVSSDDPPPGSVVIVSRDAMALCAARPEIEQCQLFGATRHDRFTIPDNWREVRRDEPPPRWIGTVLRGVGLDRHIPAQLMQKLEQPVRGTVIYQVH